MVDDQNREDINPMDRVLELYSEGGLPSVIAAIYRFIKWRLHRVFPWGRYVRRFKNAIYAKTDAKRLTGPESIYNEEYYTKRAEEQRLSDAKQVAKILYNQFQPDSVIDFGCAIGHYLVYFHEQGIDVYGVEGNEKALNQAIIPPDCMDQADLRDPYEPQGYYDLALCIEVAEHLAEVHADTLIESLTTASPTIVFTAAKPGQDGVYHVNCKPPSYWIDKFSKRGYTYDEEVTHRIKKNLSLASTEEVKENIMVFRES